MLVDPEMYRYLIIGTLVAGAFNPKLAFAFLAGLFLVHHWPFF
jgi:hypothetical protein